MNEEQANQEKDFRSLIGQFTNHSEARDKMISQIDDILDHIKQNKRPTAELKANTSPVKESDDIISQFGNIVRKMDLANEKIRAIIDRLNELV